MKGILARLRKTRLSISASLLAISFGIPGLALIFSGLAESWFVFAPATDPLNWQVRYEPYTILLWPGLILFSLAALFTVLYSAAWFLRPPWRVHVVRFFSVLGVTVGAVWSVIILLFAFVIPTGYWIADILVVVPASATSGHTHGPLWPLPIGLGMLFSGILGLQVARFIRRNPALAHPRDTRDRADPHVRLVGALCIGAIVMVPIVVFGVLPNPSMSPLSCVHDSDGDGQADLWDHFRYDPALWKPTNIQGRAFEETDRFILAIGTIWYGSVKNLDLLPIHDFYISVKSHGDTMLRLASLDEIQEGLFHGVTFDDRGQAGYLDPGDTIYFDKSLFPELSVFELTDRGANVFYGDYRLHS